MSIPISAESLLELRRRFPDVALDTDVHPPMIARILPNYAEFGPIELMDDGDEATLVVGNFTHVHFGCYEDGLSDEQTARFIASDVGDFLEKLFTDQLECFGSHIGVGGVRPRSGKSRSWLSRLLTGRKVYVWSGPNSDAQQGDESDA